MESCLNYNEWKISDRVKIVTYRERERGGRERASERERETNLDVDVHQRRKCKRLKGAAAGLKTERSGAASRNPPLTRSTRCCHEKERVIGSFELLKEAGRPYTRPVRQNSPPFAVFPRFSQPLFLPVPLIESVTLQQLVYAREYPLDYL